MKHIIRILFLIACCWAVSLPSAATSHSASGSVRPSLLSIEPFGQEADLQSKPTESQEEKKPDPQKPKEGQSKPAQEEKKPDPKQGGKPPASQGEKKPDPQKPKEGEAVPPAQGTQQPTAPQQQETKPPETEPVPPLPPQQPPVQPEQIVPPAPQLTPPPPPREPFAQQQPQTSRPAKETAPPPKSDSTLDELGKTIAGEIEKFSNAFSLWKIVLAIIILVAVYLTDKILSLLLERIATRRKVRLTWLRRGIPFVSFGLWFFALAILIGIFADSSVAVVIFIVVAALAVIFASQQILRDLMGGITILFERPFQLGDRVRIGEHYGEVTKIGLRAFQLKDSNGATVAIPNAEVVRQPVANANPGAMESQITTELLLPADIDIDEARRIAFEAAAISPYVYINKPIEVQVDEEYKNELLTKIIIKAYVFDAQYERELRSDTVERARKGFQQKINGSNDARRPSASVL